MMMERCVLLISVVGLFLAAQSSPIIDDDDCMNAFFFENENNRWFCMTIIAFQIPVSDYLARDPNNLGS